MSSLFGGLSARLGEGGVSGSDEVTQSVEVRSAFGRDDLAAGRNGFVFGGQELVERVGPVALQGFGKVRSRRDKVGIGA